MRATIIADASAPEQVAAAEAWLARWREALASCSEDLGCGCCVHIWDVDAPEAAVAEIPAELRAESEWSRAGAT